MGGRALPNNPDFLTRTQASEEIAKALSGSPDSDEKHIAYRRIGEYKRNGKLPSEPIAGGRTRQFNKRDLFLFAKELFGVEVEAFKIKEESRDYKQNKQINGNVAAIDPELIKDIESIIHLNEKKLLEPDKALQMIHQLIKKSKEEQ